MTRALTHPQSPPAPTHWIRLIAGAFLALAALVVSFHVGFEWSASRRADAALARIRIGAACDDVVTVAEEYANADSAWYARRACAAKGEGVTLNFSRGTSLNYLFTVDFSRDGRVTGLSSVGAW